MTNGEGTAGAPARPRYRLLILGEDGVVLGTESLLAGSDEEAAALARAMARENAVELWDGLRFIGQFASDAP